MGDQAATPGAVASQGLLVQVLPRMRQRAVALVRHIHRFEAREVDTDRPDRMSPADWHRVCAAAAAMREVGTVPTDLPDLRVFAPHFALFDESGSQVVAELIQRLTPREREVLSMRFGLPPVLVPTDTRGHRGQIRTDQRAGSANRIEGPRQTAVLLGEFENMLTPTSHDVLDSDDFTLARTAGHWLATSKTAPGPLAGSS